jgi:hypothetical protein
MDVIKLLYNVVKFIAFLKSKKKTVFLFNFIDAVVTFNEIFFTLFFL